MHLAREIMAQTRIYKRLRYSLLRRADLKALALTLVKVSQMIVDLGEVTELHINPLWVNAQGVVALDARVHLTPSAKALDVYKRQTLAGQLDVRPRLIVTYLLFIIAFLRQRQRCLTGQHQCA